MLDDIDVSSQFVKAVHDNLGERGDILLARLPSLLSLSIERWRLKLESPFSNLTFNYVIPGRDNLGRAIVLKIGLPSKELKSEAEALTLFKGKGAISIYDALSEEGILLLERAIPGLSLVSEKNQVRATEIAALTMKMLWVDVPGCSSFPSVADWMKGFLRLRERYRSETGPLPEELVADAERISKELLASDPASKLLHGDLHQDNIVKSGDETWVAIDPKGLVGDPAYEVGAFLRNPGKLYDDPVMAKAVVNERLDVFEDRLQFSRDRMLKWAYVQAVLSAYWVIEDGGSTFAPALACARVLKDMLEDK